jgi:hypothetical protein
MGRIRPGEHGFREGRTNRGGPRLSLDCGHEYQQGLPATNIFGSVGEPIAFSIRGVERANMSSIIHRARCRLAR